MSKELLAVLDMSEDDIWIWLRLNYYPLTESLDKFESDTLADLAFRLRDEVVDNWIKYTESLTVVWAYWCSNTWTNRHSKGENKKHIKYRKFWMFHAQPIHWIIAALIAKEKDND